MNKEIIMDVAFLGLGQMGFGMAGQLIEAGHRVVVWNRDAAKSAPFGERGRQAVRAGRRPAG
jgi:3-hydroxyisobutyrate dehydrogenase-like beta-hydroxyacid dehydrogenase